MTESTCRCCGKPIIWMKTKAGRNMPCDDKLVPYWAKADGHTCVLTNAGELRKCELSGESGTETGQGRVPHWITCNDPDQFRKRGKP
jgi:hypothetical protein